MDYIREDFNVVSACFKKIASIIIRKNNRMYFEELMTALKDTVYLYRGTCIDKEVRLLYAETMIVFQEGNMLRR